MAFCSIPLLEGGVDLSNLPLAHVGQIEVYRGAGAGGNGLGGDGACAYATDAEAVVSRGSRIVGCF